MIEWRYEEVGMSIIYTWTSDGLVHQLTHTNTERRAGRTACGMFTALWETSISNDETAKVSCLGCISSAPFNTSDAAATHQAFRRFRTIALGMCGATHMTVTDARERCMQCGYGHWATPP